MKKIKNKCTPTTNPESENVVEAPENVVDEDVGEAVKIDETDGKRHASRSFVMMLYPDATNYNLCEVLTRLISQPEWAWVEHDCDKDDDGAPVKPHVHALVRYESVYNPSTIRNKLGLPPEVALFKVKSVKAYLRYMLHRTTDSMGKYQYPQSALNTNILNAIAYAGIAQETDCMTLLCQAVDEHNFSYVELGRWILAEYPGRKDIWDAFRRNGYWIRTLCDTKHSHQQELIEMIDARILERDTALREFYADKSPKEAHKETQVYVDMALVNEIQARVNGTWKE